MGKMILFSLKAGSAELFAVFFAILSIGWPSTAAPTSICKRPQFSALDRPRVSPQRDNFASLPEPPLPSKSLITLNELDDDVVFYYGNVLNRFSKECGLPTRSVLQEAVFIKNKYTKQCADAMVRALTECGAASIEVPKEGGGSSVSRGAMYNIILVRDPRFLPVHHAVNALDLSGQRKNLKDQQWVKDVLIESFRASKCTADFALDASNAGVDLEFVRDHLVNILVENKISKLDLSNNPDMNDAAILELVQALPKTGVKVLHLKNLLLRDVESTLTALGSVLKDLVELDISGLRVMLQDPKEIDIVELADEANVENLATDGVPGRKGKRAKSAKKSKQKSPDISSKETSNDGRQQSRPSYGVVVTPDQSIFVRSLQTFITSASEAAKSAHFSRLHFRSLTTAMYSKGSSNVEPARMVPPPPFLKELLSTRLVPLSDAEKAELKLEQPAELLSLADDDEGDMFYLAGIERLDLSRCEFCDQAWADQLASALLTSGVQNLVLADWPSYPEVADRLFRHWLDSDGKGLTDEAKNMLLILRTLDLSGAELCPAKRRSVGAESHESAPRAIDRLITLLQRIGPNFAVLEFLNLNRPLGGVIDDQTTATLLRTLAQFPLFSRLAIHSPATAFGASVPISSGFEIKDKSIEALVSILARGRLMHLDFSVASLQDSAKIHSNLQRWLQLLLSPTSSVQHLRIRDVDDITLGILARLLPRSRIEKLELDLDTEEILLPFSSIDQVEQYLKAHRTKVTEALQAVGQHQSETMMNEHVALRKKNGKTSGKTSSQAPRHALRRNLGELGRLRTPTRALANDDYTITYQLKPWHTFIEFSKRLPAAKFLKTLVIRGLGHHLFRDGMIQAVLNSKEIKDLMEVHMDFEQTQPSEQKLKVRKVSKEPRDKREFEKLMAEVEQLKVDHDLWWMDVLETFGLDA